MINKRSGSKKNNIFDLRIAKDLKKGIKGKNVNSKF